MPTIAEILAAKKAAAAARNSEARDQRPTVRKETMAEKIENDALEAAFAPVKPAVATASRALTRMVLNKDMPLPPGENRGQATPIQGPEDLPRSLSEREGEAIPMTPVGADKETETWHAALNAFESSLCVMRDPKEPDVVWLAVRPDREGLPPLLVHRLPWLLWDHPQAAQQGPF